MDLYQLGPFTPIYNLTRERLSIAMRERQDENERFGEGRVPYGEDPIIIEPELYCVRDTAGGERLIDRYADKNDDEIVVSMLFTCGLSGDVLCVPYAAALKL